MKKCSKQRVGVNAPGAPSKKSSGVAQCMETPYEAFCVGAVRLTVDAAFTAPSLRRRSLLDPSLRFRIPLLSSDEEFALFRLLDANLLRW